MPLLLAAGTPGTCRWFVASPSCPLASAMHSSRRNPPRAQGLCSGGRTWYSCTFKKRCCCSWPARDRASSWPAAWAVRRSIVLRLSSPAGLAVSGGRLESFLTQIRVIHRQAAPQQDSGTGVDCGFVKGRTSRRARTPPWLIYVPEVLRKHLQSCMNAAQTCCWQLPSSSSSAQGLQQGCRHYLTLALLPAMPGACPGDAVRL